MSTQRTHHSFILQIMDLRDWTSVCRNDETSTPSQGLSQEFCASFNKRIITISGYIYPYPPHSFRLYLPGKSQQPQYVTVKCTVSHLLNYCSAQAGDSPYNFSNFKLTTITARITIEANHISLELLNDITGQNGRENQISVDYLACQIDREYDRQRLAKMRIPHIPPTFFNPIRVERFVFDSVTVTRFVNTPLFHFVPVNQTPSNNKERPKHFIFSDPAQANSARLSLVPKSVYFIHYTIPRKDSLYSYRSSTPSDGVIQAFVKDDIQELQAKQNIKVRPQHITPTSDWSAWTPRRPRLTVSIAGYLSSGVPPPAQRFTNPPPLFTRPPRHTGGEEEGTGRIAFPLLDLPLDNWETYSAQRRAMAEEVNRRRREREAADQRAQRSQRAEAERLAQTEELNHLKQQRQAMVQQLNSIRDAPPVPPDEEMLPFTPLPPPPQLRVDNSPNYDEEYEHQHQLVDPVTYEVCCMLHHIPPHHPHPIYLSLSLSLSPSVSVIYHLICLSCIAPC